MRKKFLQRALSAILCAAMVFQSSSYQTLASQTSETSYEVETQTVEMDTTDDLVETQTEIGGGEDGANKETLISETAIEETTTEEETVTETETESEVEMESETETLEVLELEESSDVVTATLTKDKDGDGYTAETDNFIFYIDPLVGCYNANFDVKIEPKDGYTLSKYRVCVTYTLKGSNTSYNKYATIPNNGYNYNTVKLNNLDKLSEYIITINLLDYNTSEVVYRLVTDDNPINITTITTDEKNLLFIDERSTYKSVSFDIESIGSSIVYSMYSTKDNTADVKKKNTTLYNMDTYSFTDLTPDTEYLFTFYDSNDDAIITKTVKTSPYPASVEYTYSSDSYYDVDFKLNLSNYSADSKNVQFHYELYSTEGELIKSDKSYISIVEGQTDYEVTGTLSELCLLASTEYKVKMWLTESDIADAFKINYKEGTLTTKAASLIADDIEINFIDPTDEDTNSYFEIKIKNCNENITGKFGYTDSDDVVAEFDCNSPIEIDNSGYYKECLSAHSGLQEGTEYRFIFVIGGVEKIFSYKFGEEKEPVYHPVISATEVNPFDATLTFQLKDSDIREGATYKIYLNYTYDGDKTSPTYKPLTNTSDGIELNSDNNYTATIKTVDLSLSGFKYLAPNTNYYFAWTLDAKVTDSKDIDASGYFDFYQTLTTPSVEVVGTQTDMNINSASFDMALKGNTSNLKNDSISMTLHLKEGDGDYVNTNRMVTLKRQSDGGYETESPYTFTDLKAGTKYTVKLVLPSLDKECGSFEFTTTTDDRELTVSNVEPSKNGFKITAHVTGTTLLAKNYIILYYREKGNTVWKSNGSEEFTATPFDHTFEVTKLDSETEYEYLIGVGNSTYASRRLLSSIKTDIVTTSSNNDITFTIENIVNGNGWFDIKALVANQETANDKYILLYLCENGTETEEWELGAYSQLNSVNNRYSFYISSYKGNNIKYSTTYKYIIGIGDAANTAISNLKSTRTEVITTRDLEDSKDDNAGNGGADEDSSTKIKLDEKTAVKFKQNTTLNRFYANSDVTLNVASNYEIEKITILKDTAGIFGENIDAKYDGSIVTLLAMIDSKKAKTIESNKNKVDVTFGVTIKGYGTFEQTVTINTVNTKPSLSINTANVLPNQSEFTTSVINKKTKEVLNNISVSVLDSNLQISYSGIKDGVITMNCTDINKTTKYNVSVSSKEWTDSVKVQGTVKYTANPTLVIGTGVITQNTSTSKIPVSIKDSSLVPTGSIEAVNGKGYDALKLDYDGANIVARLELGAGETLKAGTYKYKFTGKVNDIDISKQFTVKVVKGYTTVQLKGKGSVNLANANEYMTITPTLKNTTASITELKSWTVNVVTDKKGTLGADVSDQFDLTLLDDGKLKLTYKDGAALKAKQKYSIKATFNLDDDTTPLEGSITVTPTFKLTTPKANPSKVTLYKDKTTSASSNLTTTSKNGSNAIGIVSIDSKTTIKTASGKVAADQLFDISFTANKNNSGNGTVTLTLKDAAKDLKAGKYTVTALVYYKTGAETNTPAKVKFTVTVR